MRTGLWLMGLWLACLPALASPPGMVPLLGSGGVAPFSITAHSGTISGACPAGDAVGYGPSVGSISQQPIAGKTVVSLYSCQVQVGGFFPTYFVISGFSSNPGSGYIIRLFISGYGDTATPFAYSYTSGTATWTYNPSTTFISNSTYRVYLTHE